MVVSTKLAGGMGNQMFQYAFARKISLLTNREVILNLSFLNQKDGNHTKRDYDLDLFKISENFSSDKVSQGHLDIIENGVMYNDHLSQKYKDLDNRSSIFLQGFWQSPKYFREIEDNIIEEFQFKKTLNNSTYLNMLDEITSTKSVMVAVRRTDYLNNNHHGVMPIEYYEKAKKYIEFKVSNPNYFVFSDDIEWATFNLKSIFKNATFFQNEEECVGDRFSGKFELMKNCKNFIIPNSTFSWWPAYLSRSTNKTVVYPLKWYTGSDTSIIPEDSNWHGV